MLFGNRDLGDLESGREHERNRRLVHRNKQHIGMPQQIGECFRFGTRTSLGRVRPVARKANAKQEYCRDEKGEPINDKRSLDAKNARRYTADSGTEGKHHRPG